jgi:hypothetical protein
LDFVLIASILQFNGTLIHGWDINNLIGMNEKETTYRILVRMKSQESRHMGIPLTYDFWVESSKFSFGNVSPIHFFSLRGIRILQPALLNCNLKFTILLHADSSIWQACFLPFSTHQFLRSHMQKSLHAILLRHILLPKHSNPEYFHTDFMVNTYKE